MASETEPVQDVPTDGADEGDEPGHDATLTGAGGKDRPAEHGWRHHG